MKTILIVEDEIFIALEVERIVESAGHRVVGIAVDREEALRVSEPVDIAFVDVNLRDGATGPNVAADFEDRGTHIVFVTANPGQIVAPAGKPVQCIPKPFTDDAILSVVLGRTDIGSR